jgi:hypothetical protein
MYEFLWRSVKSCVLSYDPKKQGKGASVAVTASNTGEHLENRYFIQCVSFVKEMSFVSVVGPGGLHALGKLKKGI